MNLLRRAIAIFLFLLLGGGLLAAAEAPVPQAAAAEDEWDGLPAGPGREEVYGICGACHSLMMVTQQGLDRAAWDETLVWMVEEQGMPELDKETYALVLDYLAEHYNIDSPNRTVQSVE